MPGIVYCSRGIVCVSLCERFPHVNSAGPSHHLKPEMGNDMVRGAVKSGRKSLSKAARKSGEQVPTTSYSSSEEEEDDFFDASETVRYV